MISFIEDQRIVYGVESICRVLPIAPSIARQAIAQQSAERGHFITASHVALILPKHQHDSSGMRNCGHRSKGFGMKTIRSTGSARRGTR